MNENEVAKEKKGNKVVAFFMRYPCLLAIILLVIVMSIISPVFLTTTNMMNVLRQVSMTAIIAAGVAYVGIGGNVDISTGSTVGLINMFWAKSMMELGMSPVVGALICLLIAVVIGIINGYLVAYVHINNMIATFAMQSILRGLVYIISDSYPVYGVPESVKWLSNSYVFGVIPTPAVIMIVLYIIMTFVATYTKFGRRIYAVGGNREAAHLSGIKTERVTISTYIIIQLCAALAAFILTARLNAGMPTSGTGWEFEAIIGAIIGGVSLAGGRGKVPGALLGALFVGLLVNGMTLMDVGSYYQQVVKGVILIGAIWIDTYANEHKKTA